MKHRYTTGVRKVWTNSRPSRRRHEVVQISGRDEEEPWNIDMEVEEFNNGSPHVSLHTQQLGKSSSAINRKSDTECVGNHSWATSVSTGTVED